MKARLTMRAALALGLAPVARNIGRGGAGAVPSSTVPAMKPAGATSSQRLGSSFSISWGGDGSSTSLLRLARLILTVWGLKAGQSGRCPGPTAGTIPPRSGDGSGSGIEVCDLFEPIANQAARTAGPQGRRRRRLRIPAGPQPCLVDAGLPDRLQVGVWAGGQ